MKDKFDHDFGILVRSKLIELGLENVSNGSTSYNYTHAERKAVIENSLKKIYDMVGVVDTPFIKELAKQVYDNYQGMSYRNFPKLRKTYDLEGSINSIGDSVISSTTIVDERDWTRRRVIYVQPIICKSYGRSVSSENIQLLLDFFASRPVFNLNILKSQIEETIKLLYEEEHKFQIKLNVFYGD